MYLNVWKITCVDNDPLNIAFQFIDFRIHRFYISGFALKRQLLPIFASRWNPFSTSQAIYNLRNHNSTNVDKIITSPMNEMRALFV